MKKIIIITIIVSSLSITAGCRENRGQEKDKPERIRVTGVVTEEAAASEVDDYYEAAGSVRAKTVSLVSARITGEVKDIKVRISERVKKGDPLLTISSPDIEAKAKAAMEALSEAEKGLKIAEENSRLMDKTEERYKRLFDQKAISEQEFDEISTKREVALLQYELAQKILDRTAASKKEADAFEGYSVIRAPADGIVTEKMIDKGSMAVPGSTLFVIEEPVYRIEVPVDEKMFSSVRVNEDVLIFIEAIDLSTKGRIDEIVHQIDPATRTFSVKVTMKEGAPALRSGFYAKVRFPIGRISKLFVPQSSVVQRGELKGVYVVDKEGILTFRLVKTGKHDDGRAEILSGLTAGERIIISGTDKAVDGGIVADNRETSN